MHDYTCICIARATMLIAKQRIRCTTIDIIGVRLMYTQYQGKRCMWARQISELADPITFFDVIQSAT